MSFHPSEDPSRDLNYASVAAPLPHRVRIANFCGFVSFILALVLLAWDVVGPESPPCYFWFGPFHPFINWVVVFALIVGTALSAIRLAQGPARVLGWLTFVPSLALIVLLIGLAISDWSDIKYYWYIHLRYLIEHHQLLRLVSLSSAVTW